MKVVGARREPSPLDLRVLGRVEALRDGRPVPLGGPRQQVLLALLLIDAPHPVAIDRLADELWSGEPPDGAPTTMRAYVSKLRTVLGAGAAITGSAAGYALEVQPDRVDAVRFERLAKDGHEALERHAHRRAATVLRTALDLWRSDAFDGLNQDGALRTEAQRLEDLRLSAFEDRVEADLALGQHAELIDDLERGLRDHPYRERLWRQLMLALYRAERQADALAAYRRARKLLDDDLGLEPGEELQRLEQAILRHDLPGPPVQANRHNLPAMISTFVGREQDLADIENLLHAGRFVTLTGVGGVGKTRLAIEAATRALGDAPDGVYLVDLSAPSDPGLVADHVAAVLGIREQAEVELTDALIAGLRDSTSLLVLDNCEHLREAVATLCARLLAACPRLRVLTTSREALGVPGEVEYAVMPLPVPSTAADLDALRASDAVSLFSARASEGDSRRSPGPEDLATIAGICRDLDGLPLAIELAAARVKAFSLEEIASRLDDRFRFLVSWRRLAPARHRTLRAAMDWSYELLTDSEQVVLDRASVFAGSFTRDAAAAVCLDASDDVDHDIVGRLVDASLVVPEVRDGSMHYRLLETVRQYAAEQLDLRQATNPVRRRHADYFLTLAESAETHGPGQAQGLRQLDEAIDNLRAAVDFAIDTHDVETELRLVSALWPYWHVRGHLGEGRERLEAAIARPGASAAGAVTRAIFGAGILAWSVGDYVRVRVLANELLAAARANGSMRDKHSAYKLLSHLALRERDFSAAERYSKRTLALARKLRSDHDVSTAQLNLAVVYLDWGRTEAAIPRFEDVLAYNRRSGNVEGAGFALLNLGEADYHLGDYGRARDRFAEARQAFASVGFSAHVGHAITGLAAVESRGGHHQAAARLLGRADAMLARVGASGDDFDPILGAEVRTAARSGLGEDAFRAAYEDGQRSETET